MILIIIGQVNLMRADESQEEYDEKWSSFFESPEYKYSKFYEAMKACVWTNPELLPPFLCRDEIGRYVLSFDSEMFKSNNPDGSGVDLIFKEIKKNAVSLKEIRIVGDIFTEDSFNKFLKHLKENKSITKIQLINARMARLGIPTFHFDKLYKVLKERSTPLLSLDISGMVFYDDNCYRYNGHTGEILALSNIDILNIKTINIRDSELHCCEGWTCMLPCVLRTHMDENEITIPLEESIKLQSPAEDVCDALGQLFVRDLLPDVTCVEFERFMPSSFRKFRNAFPEDVNNDKFKQFDLIVDEWPMEELCGLPVTSLTIKLRGSSRFLHEKEVLWEALFSRNPFLSKLRISGAYRIPVEFWGSLPKAKDSLTSLVFENTEEPIHFRFEAEEIVRVLDQLGNLEELTLPAFCDEELEIFAKWFEEKSKKQERQLLPTVTIGDKQFPEEKSTMK